MAANPKTLDSMSKHLPEAERRVRQQAEAEMLPQRPTHLKIPRSIGKDPAARRYWKSILTRMEGLAILDDLDAEILAVYCTALSRRDTLNTLCRQLIADMEKSDDDADGKLELVGKLDGLMTKLQAHEKSLLQYADKLGMTPAGRVSLARKRAVKAAEAGNSDDLFGD